MFSAASAVVSYGPGVSPGKWADYGQVFASWNSSIPGEPPPPPIDDFLQTTLVRTYVSAVSAQEITARQNRTFTNATVAEAILSGNVETGQGNLTFWIISGGLSRGDRIYDNETAPTLNATINRVYLGSPRTVNVLNITATIAVFGGSGFVAITAFWDKPTGVLMEIQFTETFISQFYFASGSAFAIITETNLWETQSDFAIYANPSKTLQAGGSVQSTIYLTSLGGFTGDVTVAASVDYQGFLNGLSASLSRTVSKLSSGGTNSTVLTVTAAPTTPAGYYTINLTATSDFGINHYSHYMLISVQVNSAPMPGAYVPGVEPGDAVHYGMVRTYWSSVFSGPRPPFIADFESISWIDLEVRTVSGSTVTAVETLAFTNNTSRMVTISGDVNSGTGNLFPWIIAGELSEGDEIFNQPFAPRINATISRNYAGATRAVNVFNFTYSILGVSTKLVYFWDKTTGVLLEQFYNITATGVAEGLADIKATSTNIWSPSEPDFQISSTPGSSTVQKGSTVTSTITVGSLNGFAGTIQLLAVPSVGISVSLEAESVPLDDSQTATTTLTIGTSQDLSPGNYNVNITGSSNSLSHSITIFLTVTPGPPPPDFALSILSGSVSVQAGSSTTTTITITPQNGLSGSVSLSASAPNGLTVALNPTSLAGYGTATITIAADSALPAGSYDVVVIATQGSLSHSETITVTVKTATVSNAPPIFGLDPTIFYTSLVAIVLGALAILIYLRRASRPVPATATMSSAS